MKESRILLEVDGLSKSFGGVRAVQSCSFTVEAGSITGLIGPNGAGKSTVISVVSGFAKPDSGMVRFAGQQIQGWPAHNVSRLGLMRSFQSPQEWPTLTVMENMLLAAPPNGRDALWRAYLTPRRLRVAEAADRKRARELLREFALFELKDEPAGNLSGGQKRLLEFARLAMARPRMVMLDEPQSGVHPVLAERMIEAIRTFSQSGITVLIVEHNLPFLERVATRVLVMALGTCIASGTMDEIRADENVINAYLGSVAANA